MVRFRKKNIFY